jgi:hypothetical protein
MRAVPVLIVMGLVLLAAAGCGIRGRGGGAAEGGPRPRSTATLAIVSPEPGSTVDGDSVRVRLSLTGATLALQASPDVVPDEGHIHLKLDGELVSMTGTLEQDVPIAKGPHIIEAEFVANDHLPFHPRVITAVTFVVP